MALMNERAKKTCKAMSRSAGSDHTAQCHTEVPRLVQVAETALVLHPAEAGTPWASPRLRQSQQKPVSA